jgi:hypothetical protein
MLFQGLNNFKTSSESVKFRWCNEEIHYQNNNDNINTYFINPLAPDFFF